MFTTTGGRQVFVPEILGGAYDSQAEHFLRGDVDVDVDAIRHESMVVDGKVRMYFGPFPAFLRIPLNFLYPPGHGKWSRISGFCAGLVALFAFAGLVRMALLSSPLASRARNWVGNASVFGFAFGSPLLLLLGNLSIYDEAIIWGFALSLAALFFAFLARRAEGTALTTTLLGFSFCAGGALLSRVTFGVPFLLIAPILALGIQREKRLTNLSALFLPVSAAVLFYLWLSHARFGNFLGTYFDYYINSRDTTFVHKFGVFSPRRIPYSVADYFNLRLPAFQHEPPFLVVGRHDYAYSSLFLNPFSEVYISLLWSSPWLIFGAIMGIICLFRDKSVGLFERSVAIALFAQCLCILSFYGVTQRYAAELFPFLIFAFLLFLRSGRWSYHLPYLITGLVVVSVVINSLTTVSWLLDSDLNVPKETRSQWNEFLGRTSRR
ncbi:MAG: hypothetical protein ACM3KL_04640 [Alphaproteobacteria bacterium]